MATVHLSEEEQLERRLDEEAEWERYVKERESQRQHELEMKRLEVQSLKEQAKDLKRFIHAITLLRLFNRKVPKAFLKHIS